MEWKVGDRVIPIAKTRGSKSCNYWRKLKDGKVDYLYVVGNDIYTGKISVNYERYGKGGNWYNASDLVPYKMDEAQAFCMLINGEISDEQYNRMTGGEQRGV